MALIVVFDYLNHRDENTLGRRVRPTGFYHGKSPWFPEVHSFMEGIDLPRNVQRTFAIDRMCNIKLVEENTLAEESMTVAERVSRDVQRLAMIGSDGLKSDLAGLRPFGLNLTEAYIAAIALAVNLRREIELRKSEG